MPHFIVLSYADSNLTILLTGFDLNAKKAPATNALVEKLENYFLITHSYLEARLNKHTCTIFEAQTWTHFSTMMCT